MKTSRYRLGVGCLWVDHTYPIFHFFMNTLRWQREWVLSHTKPLWLYRKLVAVPFLLSACARVATNARNRERSMHRLLLPPKESSDDPSADDAAPFKLRVRPYQSIQ